MKRLISLATCLLLTIVTYSVASADTIHFTFQGTGGDGILPTSENPPVPGGGSGGILSGVTLDTNTNELTLDFGWGSANGFTNLSSNVSLLNIHGPTVGTGMDAWTESSGVVTSLNGFDPSFEAGQFTGSVSLNQLQVSELLAGQYYIHFHTEVNGGGEARGYFTVDRTDVVPVTLMVIRGTLGAGTINDLEQSDNSDYSIRRSTTDVQSRTEFETTSTSPTANPSSLQVSLEGSVFARTGVVQTIELFDYDASEWVSIDSRNATRFTDSTVTASATGDTARFVAIGSREIRARVRFVSDNPRQRFTSNTDQFYWSVAE